MSFRIDRVAGTSGLIVLLLSGKLTGEDVNTLRNVLRQEPRKIAIDLANVSLVDREAVQLLARAEYNGTELRNCPNYVREWIKREEGEIHGEN